MKIIQFEKWLKYFENDCNKIFDLLSNQLDGKSTNFFALIIIFFNNLFPLRLKFLSSRNSLKDVIVLDFEIRSPKYFAPFS